MNKALLTEVIYDKNGKAIRRSKNLAGIRAHVAGRYPPKIKTLSIANDKDNQFNGRLTIQFENGDNYDTRFADFRVLKSFVQRWRSVYGAPLIVNGEEKGCVAFENPALI